jgi:hypothetical protein
MYYLKISDDKNGDTLIYYCRNCGHEDTTLTAQSICVSETQLKSGERQYTHMVNEYTKYDPTLPRINTIKCPNQTCASNGDKKSSADKGKEVSIEKEEVAAAANTSEEEELGQSGGAGEQSSKKATKKITVKKSKTVPPAAAAESLVEKDPTPEAAAVVAEEPDTRVKAISVATKINTGNSEREVIYIRYDDVNMKYVYVCAICDMMWKTDNRN